MKEFQQRRLLRRFMHSRALGVAVFILLLIMAKASYGIYQKYKASVEQRLVIEKRLKDLEARSTALSITVEKLSTDKGVEEEIRRQFNMVKDGEEVAVITESAPIDQNEDRKEHWWQKVFGFFGF